MENYNFKYAGFGKRFSALVIDLIVFLYFSSTLNSIIIALLINHFKFNLNFDRSSKMAYFMWLVYLIIVRWCYCAGMESSPLKATLGKLAVGIQVVDIKGEQLSFTKASTRFFMKGFSILLVGIGYFLAAYSPKKQTLHDELSKCILIEK